IALESAIEGECQRPRRVSFQLPGDPQVRQRHTGDGLVAQLPGGPDRGGSGERGEAREPLSDPPAPAPRARLRQVGSPELFRRVPFGACRQPALMLGFRLLCLGELLLLLRSPALSLRSPPLSRFALLRR